MNVFTHCHSSASIPSICCYVVHTDSHTDSYTIELTSSSRIETITDMCTDSEYGGINIDDYSKNGYVDFNADGCKYGSLAANMKGETISGNFAFREVDCTSLGDKEAITRESMINSLESIRLSGNMLTGDSGLPEELRYFENLKSFDFTNTGVTGPIPNKLYSTPWPSLTTVMLGNNGITAPLPSNLVNWPYVDLIDLSDNPLDTGFPVHWLPSTSLATLYLSSTELTGGLPSSLAGSNLVTLKLDHNTALSGQLPDPLSPSMSVLTISDSGFKGPIPESLGTPGHLAAP